MTKSDEQKFTELTGGCWHEITDDVNKNIYVCNCGIELPTYLYCCNHLNQFNPTWDNTRDILLKMKEFLTQKQFDDFITFLGFMGVPYFYYIRIEYITTHNLLLSKAVEFLEKEKGK